MLIIYSKVKSGKVPSSEGIDRVRDLLFQSILITLVSVESQVTPDIGLVQQELS